MSKFVKVMYGTTSGAKSDFVYKLNEINIANNWNPKANNGKDFGGFNYCSEECILRWLHRGDTIYDVEIPDDAEVVKLQGATIVYRTNKIIGVINEEKNIPLSLKNSLIFLFVIIKNEYILITSCQFLSCYV